MVKRTLLLCMALCALAPGRAVHAQQPAELPALVVTAENLMAADSARAQALKGQDPSVVLPGEVVLYRLRFTNHRPDPVRPVVFTNPLPEGFRYVAGSAGADRGDVDVTFSIDGGRTFVAEPMIEVLIEGTRTLRPAPPESYTHVRWQVRGWVAPGTSVEARFRGRLGSGSSS